MRDMLIINWWDNYLRDEFDGINEEATTYAKLMNAEDEDGGWAFKLECLRSLADSFEDDADGLEEQMDRLQQVWEDRLRNMADAGDAAAADYCNVWAV